MISERKIFNFKQNSFKNYLLMYLKESILFILFAFFNGLLPIIISVLASTIKNFGLQYSMAIGYITAIQLGFVQFSWTICLGLIYAFYKYKRDFNLVYDKNLVSILLILNLFFSLIFTPIFIGSSYAYNLKASHHLNTLIGYDITNYYIYTISIYVFLSGFINSMLILIQASKRTFLANFLYIIYIGMSIGLSCLFVLLLDDYNISYKSNLIGLIIAAGFSLSSIIYLCILLLYIRFGLLKARLRITKADFRYLKKSIKYSWKQLLIIVSIQIFKAIALLILGIAINETIQGIVPISYQLSRVVWYNMLYMIPFVGYGLADGMFMFGFKYQIENDLYVPTFNSLAIFAVVVSLLAGISAATGFYFLIEPLAEFYLKNNNITLTLDSMNINDVNVPLLLETLLKKKEYADKVPQLKQVVDKLKEQVDIFGSTEHKITTKQLKQVLVSLGIISNKVPAFVLTPIVNKINNILAAIPGTISNSLSTISNSLGNLINLDTRLNEIQVINNWLIAHPQVNYFTKQLFSTILQNGKATSVFSMFDVKSKNTFYFMSVWTILYSTGLILNNAKFALRQNAVNLREALLTLFAQILVITCVIAFGVTQQYNPLLPLYDAWTMPLCITGIIAIIYYGLTYIITMIKINKNKIKTVSLANTANQRISKIEII